MDLFKKIDLSYNHWPWFSELQSRGEASFGRNRSFWNKISPSYNHRPWSRSYQRQIHVLRQVYGRSSTFCIWRQELYNVHCTCIRFSFFHVFWACIVIILTYTTIIHFCYHKCVNSIMSQSLFFSSYDYMWLNFCVKEKLTVSTFEIISFFSSDYLYVQKLQPSTLQVISFYIWRLFGDGDRTESGSRKYNQ